MPYPPGARTIYKIELWNIEVPFLGLIIPRKTGIVYSNQVGGTACGHPEVEGFYVPLPDHWVTEKNVESLRDYMIRSPTYKELEKHVGDFLKADPDNLELKRFSVPAGVESGVGVIAEAWVPVFVKDTDDPLFKSMGHHIGFLTWSNSD